MRRLTPETMRVLSGTRSMFVGLKIQNVFVQSLTWALSFPSIYSFNRYTLTAFYVPGPVISPVGIETWSLSRTTQFSHGHK